MTQAGGDTDKMETCKKEFTFYNDNIYFVNYYHLKVISDNVRHGTE